MIRSYQNQYHQTLISGKLKTICLLLLWLYFPSCLNDSSQDYFLLTSPSQSGSSRLFFQKQDLMNSEIQLPLGTFHIPQKNIPVGQSPVLDFTTNTPCLLSHQKIFFSIEQGLQFQICNDSIAKNKESLQKILFGFNRKETARHRFDEKGLSTYYIKYKKLLGLIGDIQYSIDGSFRFNNSLSQLQVPASHHAAYLKDLNPSFYSNNTFSLPRVLPFAGFDVIATLNRIYFVYRQSEIRHEVLVVEIKSWQQVQYLQQAIENLFNHLNQIQTTPVDQGAAILTEYYIGSSDHAFIQFQNIKQSGHYNISIDTKRGYTYNNNLYLFAGSVVLFSSESIPEFKSSDDFTTQGQTWKKQDQLALRSRRLDLKSLEFQSFYYCRYSYLNVCGMAGLPLTPAYNSSTNTSEDYCHTSDIEMSEVNFAGIKTAENLDPDGKFIELQLKRKCRIDNLNILHGNSRTYAGEGLYNKNDFIVLTNKVLYFQKKSNILFIKNHTILNLDDQSPVFIQDMSRQITTALWIPKSSSSIIQHWGSQGAVHSIQTQEDQNRLNSGSSCGIRPDLLAQNHMNPGCIDNPDLPWRAPQLSELLLTGARNNIGQSLPEEEFIEFSAIADIEFARFSDYFLNVYDNQNTLIHKILIPPLGTKMNYVVLSRKSTQCLDLETWHTRFADLRLPNSGGRFEILKGNTILQSIRISGNLASLLNQSIRKSYHRINIPEGFENEIWQISGSSQVHSVCSNNTWASGGFEAFYDSFIVQTEETGKIFWDFFTQSPVHLRFDFYNNNEKFIKSNHAYADQYQRFNPQIAGTSGRILVRGYKNDQLFFANDLYNGLPDLYIQTISNSPGPDEYEWIRICSNTNFIPTQGNRLFIQDSKYSDHIVASSNRIHNDQLHVELRSLDQSSLKLGKNKCAILVDPDYRNVSLPVRPNDTSLWSIEKTSAIGNGLSSGEGLLIYLLNPADQKTILTSHGLVDAPALVQFQIPVTPGQCLERKPGTWLDMEKNFEVVSCN